MDETIRGESDLSSAYAGIRNFQCLLAKSIHEHWPEVTEKTKIVCFRGNRWTKRPAKDRDIQIFAFRYTWLGLINMSADFGYDLETDTLYWRTTAMPSR